jgi:hypothetical protein
MTWIDEIDDSLALLRAASLPCKAMGVIAIGPFTSTLLYFVLNCLQSGDAATQLAGASLQLTATWIWKQCWQAAFAAELHDHLTLQRTPWTRTRLLHLIFGQCAWMPLSLLLLPLSFLSVLSFPAAMEWFRRCSLRSAFPDSRLGLLPGDQRRHYLVYLLLALCFLAMWVNLLVTLVILPQLALSFFGYASSITQMGIGLMNRITALTIAVLTWSLFEPLLDAYYVRRAFLEEGRSNAGDLRASWRRAMPRLAAVLLLCCLFSPVVMAQNDLPPEELAQHASDVLRGEEFAWQNAAEWRPHPMLRGFRDQLDSLSRRIDEFLRWLEERFQPERSKAGQQAGASSPNRLSTLLLVLSAFLGIMIAVFLWRNWAAKSAQTKLGLDAGKLSKLDLEKEDLAADALDEGGWLSLADTLMQQGDYRLAMRAIHLAGLRTLSAAQLISLARWKSGFDYQQELARRTRAWPETALLFRERLRQFEMVWYGRHEATADSAQQLRESWIELRRSTLQLNPAGGASHARA